MIPTQTFTEYPLFGDSSTRTAPGSAKYSEGFQQSDVLPAEWMNWAWYHNTKGITDLNTGLSSTEAELNAVVEAGGNTPSESTEGQVLAGIKYLIAQAKAEAILAAHPIGSLYWSSASTDPSTIFGGTWTQIKDTFILAAGDTYTEGATGGEATHTLTVAEMPSHTHSFTPNGSVSSSFTGDSVTTDSQSTSTTGTNSVGHTHSVGTSGSFGVSANSTTGTAGILTVTTTSLGSFGSGSYKFYTGKISGSTQTQSANHTHSYEHTHTVTATGSVTSSFTGTEGTTVARGSSSAHNNMPPYAVRYCWERTA